MLRKEMGKVLIEIVVLEEIIEGLKGWIIIEIILVRKMIEIVEKEIKRKIIEKVIIKERKDDGVERINDLDIVGRGEKRDLKSREGDIEMIEKWIIWSKKMIGKNGKMKNNMRKLEIEIKDEGEFKLMIEGFLRDLKIDIILVVNRRMIFKKIERKDKVIEGDRMEVMKFRIGIEIEFEKGEIVGILKGDGDERILSR